MNTLISSMVYSQPTDCPEDLIIWQVENSGFSALAQAARDMLDGKIVKFALCEREGGYKPVIIHEIVSFGMGDGGNPADGYAEKSPRYCGEGNNPDGVGSHALIASWYKNECSDPATIAAALALAFKSHQFFFRLAE